MPRRTQVLSRPFDMISDTGISPSSLHLPRCFSYHISIGFFDSPITPSFRWFGLLRFRSPLLTESFLLSSPAGTEMFQFPAYRLIFTIYS